MESLGHLWKAGYPLNLAAVVPPARGEAGLPGYRFNRKDYWPAARNAPRTAGAALSLEADPATPAKSTKRTPSPAEVSAIVAGHAADYLGLDTVDPSKTFWELGGTSLVAIQLVSRLRDQLGCDIAPSDLMSAKSLASFAEKVAASVVAAPQPIEPGHARRRYLVPVSALQRRMWFMDQLGTGRHHYNVPMAVEIDGPIDLDLLKQSLTIIAERHDILRTRFPAMGGGTDGATGLSSTHLTISEIERDAVTAACKAAYISFFSAILSSLAEAFRNSIGIDDIVLGFPVTERPSPLVEPLIGFFVNTLPLRIRSRAEDRPSDLAVRVHGDVQQALANAKLPMTRLSDWPATGEGRAASRSASSTCRFPWASSGPSNGTSATALPASATSTSISANSI
jgi:acyl carrier protein